MLGEQLAELVLVDSVFPRMRSLSFKKNECKPWQHKQWCIGEVNSEYIYRMENLLDLYDEDYDPLFPVVCLDEKPVHLSRRLDVLFQPNQVVVRE